LTELRTDRLVLRPRQPTDFDAYHALFSDWEVVKWSATWPWPPDPDFTRDRLSWPQPEGGLSAVIVLDGAVIGSVTIANGELGYALMRSHWGRGLALEACHAMVDWAFGTGHDALTAGVFDGNHVSVRILTRLGFVATGPHPGLCRARGVELPGTAFALARADWRPVEFPVPAA
jgi:RimJ/RimL family protein N-acetyltransferase